MRVGLMPGVPEVNGAPHTANGTATAGTLYVHGRQRQFAVRVFGVTGRTRVIRYEAKSHKWIE